MTKKEYFKSIAQIRRYTATGKLEEAERLLEQMYAYKPVRLLWFVAKAEYLEKKTKDPIAAIEFLDNKFVFEPGYPGLKECIEFRAPILREHGRLRDAIREEYLYQKTCGKSCHELDERLAQALDEFAEDTENKESLTTLGDAFYHVADLVSNLIVRMEQVRTGVLSKDSQKEWYHQVKNCLRNPTANFGYLEEKISAEETNTFILIMDEYLNRPLEILGSILGRFGHQVFLLLPPALFETEVQVALDETLAISLEQTEIFPDMRVILPIMLTQDGKSYGDNRAYLADYICRHESKRDNAVVLCSGYLLEDLSICAELHGRFGRLSAVVSDATEERMQFGWVGNYLSHISDIYGYDVRETLDIPAETDFSIVIPVRNSAETLRYTLQTCLNQRYQGSYEIVVSDNSVDQDTSIYELCQELNDPRIRYVRTPRLLQLTKSFEFAYLQARGEFILSIGSDDALLPWGLEVVRRVLDQFPNENIIGWERGFYAWPGFNAGQENMLQIPRKYQKGMISVYPEETKMDLKRVAQNIGYVYNMPLLYINSGFRRRHLKTLFQKTGKLWDGANQDLQAGIINCCIYDHYIQVCYPVTMAGMSDTSMGYLSTSGAFGGERKRVGLLFERQQQHDNVGIYAELARERRMMAAGVDACTFYIVLSRAVEEGLISPDEADQVLNWQTAVQLAFETYLIVNDNYDYFVHSVKAKAKRLGKTQADWFKKQVYQQVLVPRYIDENKIEHVKSYQEGTNQFGGETLDASKYGVRNVAEAATLFATRTGL